MKEIKEISIILVGEWNTKIFTPRWIINELLELKKNKEVEIQLSDNVQIRYRYKMVYFIPTDKTFEIRFNEINNESKNIANKAAIKLITTLPYTPNLLVGFNYKLETDFDYNKIIVPNYSDKYSLHEIRLVKEEKNYLLSIILNKNKPKVVTYNFHYSDLQFIKDSAINEHIQYIQNNGN